MKEFTITYTRNKPENLDEPFALLTFVVYNERELDEVIKNIESHFDGIVIEAGGPKVEDRKKKRKRL